MRIFNDKAYEDFKEKINEGESIIEFMDKNGLDVSNNGGNFYKCPFHTDKTPSLSINDKKGLFKCFSCGRGGRYFDFLYQYHKTILSYKKSQKEFANDLILKNKVIQKKYGIESLDRPVEFSPDTIEYMLDVKKLAKKNKMQLRKGIKSKDVEMEISPRLEIERKIKETRDIDEIMDLFAEIQKGNIFIS